MPDSNLHENWNRFYDPSTGRYLSPEPLLQSPMYTVAMAQQGFSTPAYAYALNNPVNYYDPDGFDVYNSSGRNLIIKPSEGPSIKWTKEQGTYVGDQDGFAFEDAPGEAYKTVNGTDARINEQSEIEYTRNPSCKESEWKRKRGQKQLGGKHGRNSWLNAEQFGWRDIFRVPPNAPPRPPPVEPSGGSGRRW